MLILIFKEQRISQVRQIPSQEWRLSSFLGSCLSFHLNMDHVEGVPHSLRSIILKKIASWYTQPEQRLSLS